MNPFKGINIKYRMLSSIVLIIKIIRKSWKQKKNKTPQDVQCSKGKKKQNKHKSLKDCFQWCVSQYWQLPQNMKNAAKIIILLVLGRNSPIHNLGFSRNSIWIAWIIHDSLCRPKKMDNGLWKSNLQCTFNHLLYELNKIKSVWLWESFKFLAIFKILLIAWPKKMSTTNFHNVIPENEAR